MMARKSKVMLASLLVGCSLMLISTFCYAGAVRCEVKVDLVGSTTSNSVTSGYVFLAHKVGGTCPGWGTRSQNNFKLPTENGDGMLAVLLTATSLGKPVLIHSPDDTFPNWGLIEQVYLAP